MAFEYLVFACYDVAEFQRNSRRKLVEYLDHHLVRRGNAPVQGLAAIGRIVSMAVRKCGVDALQDARGIERPRYRVGCAQGPGLHHPVVQRVGENKQPRHRAVGFVPQLVSNPLHAFGRAQIDIDHDPRDMTGRGVGKIRCRDGIHLAHGLQDIRQLAALIGVVGRQQQVAFGRRQVGLS